MMPEQGEGLEKLAIQCHLLPGFPVSSEDLVTSPGEVSSVPELTLS